MSFYSSLTLLCILSLFLHCAIAFDVEYPKLRFSEFSELTAEQKVAAKTLGYDETSWNHPGTADVEYFSWWYLAIDYYDKDKDGEYYEPNTEFLDAAKTLGYVDTSYEGEGEDLWDCWVNHYNDYDWNELVEWDLDTYFWDLGWTQKKWEATDTVEPSSSHKLFKDLTDKEKTAAIGLCYTQKLWDYQTMPFCMDSPRDIKIGKNARSCDWVGNNMKRCKRNNGEISKHCSNTCGSCDENKCTETNKKFLWNVRDSDSTNVYKRCRFAAKGNREGNCRKEGMMETCPATCGAEHCRKERLVIVA